ncbi:STAS domain-containing protein [Kallotenue papyrolyticum]|uniref:STAS domain-containing protein n=1 Tax=Kallotenue papyrolyticum TaxID=1325125 RepID=UPI0004926960|nr:STAS domain-containing protein [Kallotenue papyrolyticum]
MLSRLVDVRAQNSNQYLRSQLVKVCALLFIAAAGLSSVLMLTTSLLPMRMMPFNLVIIVGSVMVYALAQRGHATLSAALLCTIVSIAIALTATPLFGMFEVNPASYIVPALLAGLLIGSQAAALFGILAVLEQIITAAWLGQLTQGTTITGLLVLGLVSILTWLTIQTLERAAEQARQQTNTARQAEAELRQQQQALEAANHELRSANQQQAALLELVRDLETPAIPILDGVLALPLIGHLDTRRAAHLTEAALQAVHRERARVVIIDITGVSVVDSAVAQRIEQLAQAIRLLGARVMLTGMRAEVAQTIAAQGLDFSAVETAGRLQDGVARVLDALATTPAPTPAPTPHSKHNGLA